MASNLTRRTFLQYLGAGAAAMALPGGAAVLGAKAGRQGLNLLFLFADQMHGFALGCMGDPEYRTPHLDRLAREGTLFRNAYSCVPLCTPFRATLFTGRYGSQTGILGNGARLPKGEKTLADCLNDGGCRTGYVGKWHLGGAGNGPIAPELRGGFTEFLGYQCYNDFEKNVLFFDENGNKVDGGKHRTDATTDLAIQRLERMAGRPFALFVSYQNPHYPLQPSPEYEAMYRDARITRRPNCRDIDPYTATHSPPAPKPKDRDPVFQRYGNNLDMYLRLYHAMVTQLDANIGRLLAALDRLGLRETTAVVFTSDHGDMAGSHGLKNKRVAWEESARIPLIVRVPGGPAGQIVDAPASSVDFLPTCLGLAGLPAKPGAEGADLSGAVRGGAANPRRPVFSEMGGWCLIRRGDFKLVARRPDIEPEHLFDLKADPYEMADLVDNPAHASTREALLSTLREWNSRVRKK